MSHGMTAQYLNECVHKHIGLAVVDRESDTWGWVHDQHKNESGWVIGDTHDDRIQELRDGAHIKPALPAEYEKYEFVEETDPTETTYADRPRIAISGYNPAEWKDPGNLPEGQEWCEDCGEGHPTENDPVEEGGIHTPFVDRVRVMLNDPVNPNHYQGFSNGAEVIDITENLTFSAGNAVKYLSRAGRIDGQNKGAILEDLRKAAWYVSREIDRIEAQK